MTARGARWEQRSWHAVAVKLRKALEQLDWPVPPCLPGERDECGRSDAEHAAGYLGALRAVVDFKIEHLHGDADIAEAAFVSTRDELAAIEAARPCGCGH